MRLIRKIHKTFNKSRDWEGNCLKSILLGEAIMRLPSPPGSFFFILGFLEIQTPGQQKINTLPDCNLLLSIQ